MGIVEACRGGAAASRPPLALRWDGVAAPLPVQVVRGHGYPPAAPTDRPPLNFSVSVHRLCADIARRCPEFGHVRAGQVLFGFTQARNRRSHGLQARVTPLRFHGGRLIRRHRGIPYQVQRFVVEDLDVLYLMTFCLPRFLNQSYDDKLVTVFHELFHIGPHFDGDLRRHGGRYTVHSHSQRQYDRHMANLARAYLATDPDRRLLTFLRYNFAELRRRHGAVVGVVVPRPKLVPLSPEMV